MEVCISLRLTILDFFHYIPAPSSSVLEHIKYEYVGVGNDVLNYFIFINVIKKFKQFLQNMWLLLSLLW